MRRTPVRAGLLIALAIHGFRSSRTFVLLVVAVALGAGFEISNTAALDGFESAIVDDALEHGAGDVRISPRTSQQFDNADVDAAALGQLAGAAEAIPVLVYPGAIAALGASKPRGSNVAGAGSAAGSGAGSGAGSEVGSASASASGSAAGSGSAVAASSGAGSVRFLGASVWGVDPTVERPPFRLVSGALLGGAAQPSVLVGTALAARLEVNVGDAVELRVILGAKDQLLGTSNIATLRGVVRGIVSGTGGAYRSVFVDRHVLGELVGRPDAAQLVLLHLGDHGAAGSVAARIAASRPDVEARAWYDDDPGWASYLGARKAVGGISYAMVIAAIAVPMWSLLYIHVLRKRRELAILAALGFGRAELFAICTLQSMFVAIIGCVFGAALGYVVTRYFAANPLFEWESLVVRPDVTLSSFVVPSVVLVATSIVAALHPASRAARIAPAAVLRSIE